MLRFQETPDRIFTEILRESIETMIDSINDVLGYATDKDEIIEDFKSLLPNAGKIYNPRMAVAILKRMLTCHRRPRLYYLNDYHYLLLYDTLENYCSIRNDLINHVKTGEEKKELSKLSQFYVEKIDFDGLVNMYFFDTDFLLDSDSMLRMGIEDRKRRGLSNETFGVTQGLTPHPEELLIRVQRGEKAVIQEPSRYFGPRSKVYPDYDYIEE